MKRSPRMTVSALFLFTVVCSGMKGYVYVLTNKHNKVLYTGVTKDLRLRLKEHSQGSSWFTTKYKTSKLFCYEYFDSTEDAIAREKKLKNMSHTEKHNLISGRNKTWQDLTETPT